MQTRLHEVGTFATANYPVVNEMQWDANETQNLPTARFTALLPSNTLTRPTDCFPQIRRKLKLELGPKFRPQTVYDAVKIVDLWRSGSNTDRTCLWW